MVAPLYMNITTNDLLYKWRICWIYCTCHCTAFSIGKIGFSASASSSVMPMVVPNSIPTVLLAWIWQQINYCVNDILAEFIVHVTVLCLLSGEFVPWHRHQHRHLPHHWCCQTLCWRHFVGLNTTTNEFLCKWNICWIYHTCDCTVFGVRKICSSALASSLATPMVS